jgi:transcriptional regulator with XRE-family HTH domain
MAMPSNQSTVKTPQVSARAILAANIIRLRGDLGWSQEMLAFECGLHRTFIAHVERQVRNVSLDNIEKIALALNVETYLLLKDR